MTFVFVNATEHMNIYLLKFILFSPFHYIPDWKKAKLAVTHFESHEDIILSSHIWNDTFPIKGLKFIVEKILE